MSNTPVFPGGTNTPDHRREHSPDRLVEGDGAFVYTAQGEELIDMSMAYGAQIFGHGDPEIAAAVTESLDRGWLFAEPHALAEQVANRIAEFFPSAEQVKLATTGSDTVAYALRCARSFTDQDRVLVTEGAYHGVHDGLTYSAGFPDEVTNSLTAVPFNDVEATRSALEGGEYAAFLLEPVLKDSGCVEPSREYLEAVREVCTRTDTVLIFDEVLTGARLGPGGAQARYDVLPDLMTVSKALSAGFPISAVAGTRTVMSEFMPPGEVFLAGTFNGNPLALTATDATLERLESQPVHERIDTLGAELRAFLAAAFADRGIDATVQGVGSILHIAMGHTESGYTRGLRDRDHNPAQYYELATAARDAGILLPPYHFQCMFTSVAHHTQMEALKSRFSDALDRYEQR